MVAGLILQKPRNFTITKLSGTPSCFETGIKTVGLHETLENKGGSYYDSGARIYFNAHTAWLPVYRQHLNSTISPSLVGEQSRPTLIGYNLSKVTWKSIPDNVACRINEIRIEDVGLGECLDQGSF